MQITLVHSQKPLLGYNNFHGNKNPIASCIAALNAYNKARWWQ